jgi:uncharacterized protein YbjT (DUF2867 family)
MKILVIGATSYIGSAMARAFREDGHVVTGLARTDDAAVRLSAAGLDDSPHQAERSGIVPREA